MCFYDGLRQMLADDPQPDPISVAQSCRDAWKSASKRIDKVLLDLGPFTLFFPCFEVVPYIVFMLYHAKHMLYDAISYMYIILFYFILLLYCIILYVLYHII